MSVNMVTSANRKAKPGTRAEIYEAMGLPLTKVTPVIPVGENRPLVTLYGTQQCPHCSKPMMAISITCLDEEFE